MITNRLDSSTITAINESIKHWERMRKDAQCGEEPCADHCPLCKEFGGPDEGCKTYGTNDSYKVCPIARKTGLTICEDTPYEEAQLAWEDLTDFLDVNKDIEHNLLSKHLKEDKKRHISKWKKEATKEINFLKSLLK